MNSNYSTILNGGFPFEELLGGGNKSGKNDLTRSRDDYRKKLDKGPIAPHSSGIRYAYNGIVADSQEELSRKLREREQQSLRDRYFRKALQQSLNFSF